MAYPGTLTVFIAVLTDYPTLRGRSLRFSSGFSAWHTAPEEHYCKKPGSKQPFPVHSVPQSQERVVELLLWEFQVSLIKLNVKVMAWYQLCSGVSVSFTALLPWFLGLS